MAKAKAKKSVKALTVRMPVQDVNILLDRIERVENAICPGVAKRLAALEKHKTIAIDLFDNHSRSGMDSDAALAALQQQVDRLQTLVTQVLMAGVKA